MELKIVTSTTDFKRLKKLYISAFPKEERAPFWLMKRKALQGKAEFWEVTDGDIWVGLAYVVCYKDIAYLFYLAMDASLRGQGYGTKTMEALKEKYQDKRFFLALELLDETAENYTQRVHRHEFYKKCGLQDWPYRLKEASVIYAVMGIGNVVEPEEYKEMFDIYLGKWLRQRIDMRFV